MEKAILGVVAACFWIAGIWNAFLNQPASATALLGAGFCCLFFIHLPKFKRIKAFALEAEMRDKIEEVTDVLSKLRTLLIPIAELLFTTVARAGRLGSRLSNKESYDLMERIETELRAIKMTEEQITSTKKDWHRYNMIDLALPIKRDFSTIFQSKQMEHGRVTSSFGTIGDHNRTQWEALIQKGREISSEEKRSKEFLMPREMKIAAQRIRNFVRDSKCLSNDEKTAFLTRNQDSIEDLEYYAENLKFRRLDVWFEDKDS